ncbi:hypothetical protein [Paenibacillus sp. YN15]|uniref:hypothetical protein n=1 Tax=Paenibacillus sp. YN15 TaxID=1742774 RepID=UPI0015EB652E|nr:hypothetical protein [Paenibacillus sp. YN15]
MKAGTLHHELFPLFRGMFNCLERVPNPACEACAEFEGHSGGRLAPSHASG